MTSTELSYILAPFPCVLQATGADLGGEPCPVESPLWAFLSVTVVYSCAQSQHRRARAARPHPGAGRDCEQNDLLAQPDARCLARPVRQGVRRAPAVMDNRAMPGPEPVEGRKQHQQSSRPEVQPSKVGSLVGTCRSLL